MNSTAFSTENTEIGTEGAERAQREKGGGQSAFLEAAFGIGAQLCRDALWAGKQGDERCNWLGSSMEPSGGQWRVVERTFGPDLYAGTGGIALFLAHLHRLTGEARFKRTAQAALRGGLARAGDIPEGGRAGFYTGAVGLAWLCDELAAPLDDETLPAQGAALLAGFDKLDPAGQGLDVLAGLAGAIPPLLLLARRWERPDLAALAERWGDHLLAVAHQGPHGWSWGMPAAFASPGAPQHDLLGFSHGASGFGWALAELHAATGAPRFRQAAEQAFAYERAWFNPQQGNWPDLRSLNEPGFGGQNAAGQPAQPGYMLAWCHGAPGIGLARLRAAALLGDGRLRQEADIAIATTAAMLRQAIAGAQMEAAPGSFCLCHGLAGNADLLLLAGAQLDRPDCTALAQEIGQLGIEVYANSYLPWPCGVLNGGETPGLFLGLAGIGYFYLRLHDSSVPAVTILQA